MHSLFLQIGRWLKGRPKAVVGLLAALTLLAGLACLRSSVDNSIAVWQTADDPHWLHFQEFAKSYAIEDPLIAYLPGVSREKIRPTFHRAKELADVERVQLYTVEKDGGNGQLMLLVPKPESDPAALSQLIGDTRRILQSELPDTAVHLGGVWYLTDALDNLSALSTRTLFPLVLGILALGVLLVLRSPGKSLLALTCGLLPAVHLTGLMALAGEPLNMILLALPPLTMILGIAHAIHFIQKDLADEPQQTYATVGVPCLISALTTILGFLSLTMSSYGPVQKLGLWGACGALLSVLSPLMLMPIFLKAGQGSATTRRMARSWAGFLAAGRMVIFLGMAIFVVIAALGTARMEVGSFILDFFKPGAAITNDYRLIEADGIGLTPLEVDLTETKITQQALQKAMLKLADAHPEITHFISYYDKTGRLAMPVNTRHGAELSTPLLPGLAAGPPIRLTILTKTLASEKNLALVEAIETELQADLGPRSEPYISGTVPLYTRGQRALFSTLTRSFGLAFVSITLVMGLVLRSARLGLLALVPNLLPVLFILGTMGLMAIPLSVATVTVASIVFGVVVDDTIHFLHTWQDTAGSGNEIDRLTEVLAHVGPAMLTTSLVAGTGFLGFLISDFIPLKNFGLLISLSLAYAILCDLVVLPALLLPKNTNEQADAYHS